MFSRTGSTLQRSERDNAARAHAARTFAPRALASLLALLCAWATIAPRAALASPAPTPPPPTETSPGAAAPPPATPTTPASVEALARVGFTLVLPTGEGGRALIALAPPAVLALINRAVADAQGPGAAQYAAAVIAADADAARTPGSRGPLLQYPYLLVQVDERDLTQATFDAVAAPLADDLRRRLPAGAEVTLDPARGVINATHTTEAPGVGPVRTRSRGYIGRRAVVWLHLSERTDAPAMTAAPGPAPAPGPASIAFDVALDASQFQRDAGIRGVSLVPLPLPVNTQNVVTIPVPISLIALAGVALAIAAYFILRRRM